MWRSAWHAESKSDRLPYNDGSRMNAIFQMPYICKPTGSRCTLTQNDDECNKMVISYFSKRIFLAAARYSANGWEMLGLTYLLSCFRGYLKASEVEILTYNQVLKSFFKNPNLRRGEARWLDFPGQFGITDLTLVKGKVLVLGDAIFDTTCSESGNRKLADLEIGIASLCRT